MSHVKRVKRGSGGTIRVLICSKWEYENSLKEQLKNEILSLANKTTNPAAAALDHEELSVESVVLPDTLVHIREIYDKFREVAQEWPINFNT